MFVFSPMVMVSKSPRTTQFHQMDAFLPKVTLPTTTALGAIQKSSPAVVTRASPKAYFI